MLAKLCITLKNTIEKKISVNMGSVFQGILMKLLDFETAEWLHNQQRHPYSLSIQSKDELICWTISTLTKEAYEHIICPLMSDSLKELICEYHQITFQIVKKDIIIIEEEKFLEQNYFKNYSKTFVIDFITPTAFKSNGKYMNYPSVRWIFQSLMNKYDFAGTGNQIYDEEMLNMIEEQTVVTQYRLQSMYFYLEGIKIPAYKGRLKISVKGTQSTVNLVNFLLKYGEFSGVGIKSAMGMGAISVQSRERKDM